MLVNADVRIPVRRDDIIVCAVVRGRYREQRDRLNRLPRVYDKRLKVCKPHSGGAFHSDTDERQNETGDLRDGVPRIERKYADEERPAESDRIGERLE